MKRIEVVYMGARETTSGTLAYCYKEIGTGSTFLLRKKMHKYHQIGIVYSIIRVNAKSFKLDMENIEPVSKYKNSTETTTWIKEELEVKQARKARAERSKLMKLARESVRKLRPVYKRANILQQHEMLREIIQELERV